MRLIFLDRSSLRYKDYAIVSPDFDLIIDSVVTQKSNFTVNKDSINAVVGDIAVLKEENISFIGIVESLTLNEDKTMQVQLVDFKDMFDVEIPIDSFEGNLCEFLKDKIMEVFASSDDTLQNLKYLKVNANDDVEGSISYGDDSLVKITDLIELLSKNYGIIVTFKTEFNRGKFESIVVDINRNGNSISLRSDIKAVSNLEIKESSKDIVNKCVFYPKKENTTHKTIETFYLLTSGEISKDKNNKNRYQTVSFKSSYYSDNEFDFLQSKAQNEMSSESADHQITFDLDSKNFTYKPLGNLFLGTDITFYNKGRIDNTALTQIRYKGSLNVCYLTLGEQRNSLTDRIKMMNSSNDGSNKKISVTSAINADGGTF